MELVVKRPDLAVLEAPGGLEMALVRYFVLAHLPMVVVNPRKVPNFAKTLEKLVKTDILDARVLARFG